MNNSKIVKCWNCGSKLTDGEIWHDKQLCKNHGIPFDPENVLCSCCDRSREEAQQRAYEYSEDYCTYYEY